LAAAASITAMGLFGSDSAHGDQLALEARIAALEAKVAGLTAEVARLAAFPLAVEALGTPPVGAPSAWQLEARRLHQAGEKIQAIKVVREATNWGLAEAKNYVERL